MMHVIVLADGQEWACKAPDPHVCAGSGVFLRHRDGTWRQLHEQTPTFTSPGQLSRYVRAHFADYGDEIVPPNSYAKRLPRMIRSYSIVPVRTEVVPCTR